MACQTCLQMFPDEEGLENHRRETGHGERGRNAGRKPANIGSFYCELCKQYYADSTEYTKHIETHAELQATPHANRYMNIKTCLLLNTSLEQVAK